VSFAVITFCVASKLVLIGVSVYFIIDSVRELLVIPSCYYSSQQAACDGWAKHVAQMGEMRTCTKF
jgi:hypothetical protein